MLTTAQLTTLAAAIAAETDPEFVSLREQGATGAIANWYRALSDVVVWKTRVTQDEIMQNGFDWTQVDNTTVGKARIWEWMFNNAERVINASKANVRAGIDEAWKGTAAMLAVRASVYVHCKRMANLGEAIFVTGEGTDAIPALLDFEGALSADDISHALSL